MESHGSSSDCGSPHRQRTRSPRPSFAASFSAARAGRDRAEPQTTRRSSSRSSRRAKAARERVEALPGLERAEVDQVGVGGLEGAGEARNGISPVRHDVDPRERDAALREEVAGRPGRRDDPVGGVEAEVLRGADLLERPRGDRGVGVGKLDRGECVDLEDGRVPVRSLEDRDAGPRVAEMADLEVVAGFVEEAPEVRAERDGALEEIRDRCTEADDLYAVLDLVDGEPLVADDVEEAAAELLEQGRCEPGDVRRRALPVGKRSNAA